MGSGLKYDRGKKLFRNSFLRSEITGKYGLSISRLENGCKEKVVQVLYDRDQELKSVYKR